jgi:hypothetical protein
VLFRLNEVIAKPSPKNQNQSDQNQYIDGIGYDERLYQFQSDDEQENFFVQMFEIFKFKRFAHAASTSANILFQAAGDGHFLPKAHIISLVPASKKMTTTSQKTGGMPQNG